MKLDAGIHHNISSHDYHNNIVAQDGSKLVNASYLKDWISKSPMEAEHGVVTISEIAARVGTAVHSEALESELNNVICSLQKSRATKAFKEEEEQATAAGKTIHLKKEYDDIMGMVHGIHAPYGKNIGGLMGDPHCSKLICSEDKICEATLIAKDPGSDLWLKCRPDIYSPKMQVMGDIKTAVKADPRSFSRVIFSLNYHIQCAFYIKVAELCGWHVKTMTQPDEDTQVFGFMSVQKTRPYPAHFHVLQRSAIRQARLQVDNALKEIGNARKTNDFGTRWGAFTVHELPEYLQH